MKLNKTTAAVAFATITGLGLSAATHAEDGCTPTLEQACYTLDKNAKKEPLFYDSLETKPATITVLNSFGSEKTCTKKGKVVFDREGQYKGVLIPACK